MSDFDTLCNKLAEMDHTQFKQIFNEMSVRVMEELTQVMMDGKDGLSVYLEFLLASVAADGKLSKPEFELLKPMFDMIADGDVTYEQGVAMFKDMGLDQAEGYEKVVDTMVDILGLVDAGLKDDIVFLCLLVCAIDGEVTEKEKDWIRQLMRPLTIEISAYEYLDVFLGQAGTFTLATSVGNRPRMRVLGLKLNLDGKIYFAVGTFKDVYKQLKANPWCEILASVGPDFLRWDGGAKFSDDPRLYPMLKEAMPEIAQVYYDNGWTFAFFTIEGGHAEIINVSGSKKRIF
jgi:uncharacterized pyridoxamine 5'-phosphate oxidase family protein